MFRIISRVFVGVVLAALAACSQAHRDQEKTRGPVHLAAVYVPGPGGVDYPYNSGVHQVLLKAKAELGITFDNHVTARETDMVALLRSLAQNKKYQAVVVLGFQNTKAMLQVAKEFPEQKFIGVESGTDQEGTPHKLPNVAAYTANYYEPMYTAGALAAMMTKTGIIGSVWSMDEKKYGSYVRAYTDGAHSVNPKVRVLAEYTGSYQELPPKGKAKAEELIAQGADILMNHTQSERMGVIEAIKEKGVKLVGFNQESRHAPKNALFDLNRHQSENVYQAVKTLAEGKFQAGTYYLGMVVKHYTLSFTDSPHEWITPAVRKKADEILIKFASGELKKPWTADIPDLK